MASGIELPLRTARGRLKRLTGDDYIDQLVRVALLGMESDNPFQTLGLGEWMIFGINDSLTESEIKEKVAAIFESFQRDQLAQLKDPDADITFKRDEGDLYMNVAYVNMETQERTDLSVPIPGSGE